MGMAHVCGKYFKTIKNKTKVTEKVEFHTSELKQSSSSVRDLFQHI